MDAEMKGSYLLALKDARRELARIDGRRRRLLATIEGLKGLVQEAEQLELHSDVGVDTNRSKRPAVPPDFFKGKKPTQAYRDFVDLWGDDHPIPTIRDALLEGGFEVKSPKTILATLHTVARRERAKKGKGG